MAGTTYGRYNSIGTPEAEYGLDWFPITMRITVRKPMAQGLAKEGKAPVETGSQPAEALAQKSLEKELQSLQGNLWHGHVERAREPIEEPPWELELTAGDSENRDKLLKQLREFDGIQNNRELIPNYGERYRNGERISTALVESTVNQVGMVKRQPMQWTERGAHLLLQTRTWVLNGESDETFRRWYPKFRSQEPAVLKAAA